MLALARFADDECVCWPSVTTLAARCAAGRREVQRRLDWLEAHGFIERDQRPGHSTMYRLTFEPGADGADEADRDNTDGARGVTTEGLEMSAGDLIKEAERCLYEGS